MKNFNWLNLINPEFYINLSLFGTKIGIYIVLFIIFAETGLFIGFFLPGDSLLFLSGIYSRSLVQEVITVNSDFVNVLILVALVSFVAFLGNLVGYWIGYKSGDFLYKKEDTFYFKKRHLQQANEFYESHGSLAVIFARFLPIFRTFSPIIAGIVKMNKAKFTFYNLIGAIAWSTTLIFAGHYLNELFLNEFDIDLKKHIEIIIIAIVLITTAPVIFKLFFGKKDTEAKNI